MKISIRREDTVKVISGKDKDKTGKVLRVVNDGKRVVVENVAIAKKAQHPTQQNQQGGIVDIEMPIPLSNVMLVCPECNKATRVGHEQHEKSALRVCKKCGGKF